MHKMIRTQKSRHLYREKPQTSPGSSYTGPIVKPYANLSNKPQKTSNSDHQGASTNYNQPIITFQSEPKQSDIPH